ncbi:hypothetical protein RHMOL_Rhmol06G0324000 [Rhododendron molle]|uniref:Uncharacterized protein n=1 Tax=Rhododendron molle TaxID=49168 RepID=A0ACC0NL13_RHOML|nr:hypothetical protein RHMOL_Rhmol06G0324000 [Rhododendron molle]
MFLEFGAVSALNSVFSQWGISATDSVTEWNISGEPCSGGASTRPASSPPMEITIPVSNADAMVPLAPLSHFFHLMLAFFIICNSKVYAFSVVGGIPDELWSLTNLTNLKLDQNYLTGPLSSSIANLTQMQYLSLGINSLSGEVPKELGNLTNLIVLSFSSNNFFGPLPSELGKLTKLQQLCRKKQPLMPRDVALHVFSQERSAVWGTCYEIS